MIDNPFTPVFGGKPEFFFGRKDILARFENALIDRGSEDRALFITGTRGSGKTALVEQLSLKAARAGWRSIDIGPEEPVHALLRRLVGHDERTSTVNPQVSVSVLGSGASMSGVSTSKTTHVDRADLDLLLIDACKREKKGILLTIDEVQKLDEQDISLISNAFQMASRKGHNAIVVLAGLPYAHDQIIRYKGCTYMRRAAHERLTLLPREEVIEAFDAGLFANRGLTCEQDAYNELIDASYGHPYLVQLLGFYLIDRINNISKNGTYACSVDDIRASIDQAIVSYGNRALKPMVEELSSRENAYLGAMAQSLDANRVAKTADIAQALGKPSKSLSAVRDALVRNGIIVPVGRGEVRFAIPYLAQYMLGPSAPDAEERLIREWNV